MPEASNNAEFTFRIHPAGGGMEIPVSLLTQSLTTLQELVQLFALKEEGRTLRERLRLPDEIKNKYILRCRPPAAGSFAVSGRVSSTASDLFPSEQPGHVMANLQAFARAAVEGNQGRLLDLVPDSRLRHRILSRLGTLSPPPGSGYRYELLNGTGAGCPLEETLPARIEALIKTQDPRSEVQTVTGRLEAISFSEHQVTIRYAPKGRWLECIYEDDLEPMLLENRRDLIQVTGRVIPDDDGHPKKIVEAEEIRDLDLSLFVLAEVVGENVRLKLSKQVTLTPTLSDSEQLICLEHPEWDLDVFAATRLELFDELKEQIWMLWTEYAKADDGDLSEPAKRLKAALLRDFQEVANA
jgi:hypothetical protein